MKLRKCVTCACWDLLIQLLRRLVWDEPTEAVEGAGPRPDLAVGHLINFVVVVSVIKTSLKRSRKRLVSSGGYRGNGRWSPQVVAALMCPNQSKKLIKGH